MDTNEAKEVQMLISSAKTQIYKITQQEEQLAEQKQLYQLLVDKLSVGICKRCGGRGSVRWEEVITESEFTYNGSPMVTCPECKGSRITAEQQGKS